MTAKIGTWLRAAWWRMALAVALGLFLLIQLVPYGHDHSNPRPTQPVAFDSTRTQQLMTDACGDCHSDLTDWPPESSVAPMSWLIQHDVEEGRGILNFSEWDKPQPELGEVVGEIQEGGMPPFQYKLLHPDARLSDAEKAALITGLTRTYSQDPPGP